MVRNMSSFYYPGLRFAKRHQVNQVNFYFDIFNQVHFESKSISRIKYDSKNYGFTGLSIKIKQLTIKVNIWANYAIIRRL
jgi:hypothetical protein